ncbi:TPA: hypothetical protein N0F65_007832 [Lagenidium giganteum]|uniref:Nucleoside diphosphate kinase-like domain-containing protein n=1 Tax=Lagenidium giganteum TaxID=4803 RepID=A0AAV2Z416_9STRA|nr:TPA: hypothetical protein N0F65_007832 [Lagenidium giganteum]
MRVLQREKQGSYGIKWSRRAAGSAHATRRVARGACASMASKAGGHHAAAAPAAPVETGPVLNTVLIVQCEALDQDEAIRTELRKKGFRFKQQTIATLTKEEASHFIYEVSNPASEMYLVSHAEAIEGEEGDQDPAALGAVATERTGRKTDDHEKGSARHAGADDAKSLLSPRESARSASTGTPREKGANGTPRTADGERVEAETPDEAIQAFGPVLVMLLEKGNAVRDLIDLVGPANPGSWASATHSSTLRARYGKSRDQLAVRCSQQELTAMHEFDFLLACSGNNRENRFYKDKDKPSALQSKTAQVRLEDLMNFLFPPHMQHSNSVGRLFVFALYGPLDHKARLRSGEKGLHVVTDQELNTMSTRIEREDILAVYRLCSLTQEEEEEVIRQVDRHLKSFPRYTKRDIEALFQPLPRDAQGCMSFHDMQRAIIKERLRRVVCMKDDVHPSLAPPVQNKYKAAMKRLTKTKDEVVPPSMFLKDCGLNGAENATLVSRLLSNYSFQICHLDDGNSPSLTQNVRLLRENIRFPGDERAAWNPGTRIESK